MADLTNKVSLVTGGSRGIGAGIAKRLAADGASVAITYTRGAEAAASVVQEIERDGGKAIAIQADATDAKAVVGAVEKTVATYGRLDVFVNNAGTAIPKPFLETTLGELDRMIELNFRGALIATQAALRQMEDGGRIIMIGSCVGERMMTPGLVAYAATKGAIKMFTQGLARGWEQGHHGQQYSTGSDRHGLESRRGRMGDATDSPHGAQPIWPRRRNRCDGGVCRGSGGGVHNGCEPDRGRWHERVI
jgi:NAD(P)-dependent dehydrogenase (short-subunit alcohol dehydrogenase family)